MAITSMLYILDERQRVIGVASNNSPEALPYFGDKLTESIETGVVTYEFAVPAKHAESGKLIANNHVVVRDLDGNFLLFTIKEAVETREDGLLVKHLFCENTAVSELLGEVIKPQKLSSLTLSQAVKAILENVSEWSALEMPYTESKDIVISEHTNLLEVLTDISKLYELEMYFTVELTNMKITKKIIHFVKKRGNETNVRFEYGLNLTDVTRKEDSTGVITALYGIGKNSGDTALNLTGYGLVDDGNFYHLVGSEWIGSHDALTRWGRNGKHIFGIYKSDTADTTERLYKETLDELKRRVNPVLTYEASVVTLERITGFDGQKIRVGDRVLVIDKTFNPAILLSARVVELQRSFTNPLEDLVKLGEYRPLKPSLSKLIKGIKTDTENAVKYPELPKIKQDFTDEVIKPIVTSVDEIEGKVEETVQAVVDIDAIMKEVQDKVTAVEEDVKNRESKIYRQPTPPTDVPVDTLWINTEKNIMYRWDGNAWEELTPSLEGVAFVEDLNNSIAELDSKIQGQMDDKANLNDFTNKVAEIKTTTDGLSSSVTEVSRKVDGQETRLGLAETAITQTQHDITLKVNSEDVYKKTELDPVLNSKVDSTTYNTKIAAIEATNTSISQRVEEVNKTVTGISVGGRNLLTNTASWNTTIISSNSAYGVFKDNLNTLFSTLVGKTVTFSFDVKIDTTDGTSGRVQLYCTNGSPKYAFATKIFTGITSTFQRLVYTTTITENTANSGQARIELWGWDAKTTKIYLRNFKMEIGNMPTDYTVAPEEIDAAISDKVPTATYTQKIAEIKTTTDGITQRVSDVETTSNDLGTRLSTAESSITTQAGQISSKVSQTTYDTFVGDMKNMSPSNLLHNSEWKTDLLKWGVGTGWALDTTKTFQGTNTAKQIQTGNAADRWYALDSEKVYCTAGDTFTASIYAYTDDITTFDRGCALEIDFYDVNNARITLPAVAFTPTGTWTRYTVTGTAPTGVVYAKLRVHVTRNGRLWVSRPMLQSGKLVSAFTPHADEMATELTARVSSAETWINQTTTDITFLAKKDEVGSILNQSPTGFKIAGRLLDISGLVTFGTFDQATQDKINAIDTKAGTAQTTANTANTTANTANSTANSVKSKTDGWTLNTTYIDGGKIYTGTVTASQLNVNNIFANSAVVSAITAYDINADKIKAGTIRGIKYESINATNANIKLVLEGNTVKSYGAIDSTTLQQPYAEFKEGSINMFQYKNGTLVGGASQTQMTPDKVAVWNPMYRSELWSGGLFFNLGSDGSKGTVSITFDFVRSDGSASMILGASGGVMIRRLDGGNDGWLKFDDPSAIEFNKWGNIKAPSTASDGASWNIVDKVGRTRLYIPVGNSSSSPIELRAQGGGIDFWHNNYKVLTMYQKNANTSRVLQFGDNQGIFKWEMSQNRFEFRNGDDSNWSNAAAGSFQNASSLVWKTDIQNYEGNALDVINSSDVMTFKMKPMDNNETNEIVDIASLPTHIGLIAEYAPPEVQAAEGTAVDLYAMISVAWKAIQELTLQINEIKAENVLLKGRLDGLNN